MSDSKVRRIGVLTSGGDAPGMNAAVRSVVHSARSFGISVIGIRRGYAGLLSLDLKELEGEDVNHLLPLGGTALFTARCDEMKTPQGLEKAANTCRHMGIDGLIVAGGDGSFRGALALAEHGIKVIGIPATIDNDIGKTEYSIGFDTACNTAIEAVDKLRDTMQSHERCSVVEVMGRHAGHLALQVGVSVGACCVLLPERAVDMQEDVIEKIRSARLRGRRHHIVVVAEGYGHASAVAQQIEEFTGLEARLTILGHIQRGGAPSMYDRIVATQMGYHAVGLLAAGQERRAVGLIGGHITDLAIDDFLGAKRDLDQFLFDVSQTVVG